MQLLLGASSFPNSLCARWESVWHHSDFCSLNKALLGLNDWMLREAGGLILLGKDSELAVPQGTTNPSNVQGFNDAQAEAN